MNPTTTPAAINAENFKAAPEGYQLDVNSTEPCWLGSDFDDSWASWDFTGFTVWAYDGKSVTDLPLAQAIELHRQLTGVLTNMGALPTPSEVAA
ncbi:hypothetical protein [Paenarthrobacter sp. Y-19]|uniref:hypothetical protein n=1 Tax=Paenarthrobacter sp. Y-19 TaxID=3031125 RepID=UPI0023DC3592|nr:hypothetical protein [Paenarthrobacter sp. Y-19]